MQYKVALTAQEFIQPGGNLLPQNAKVVVLSEKPDNKNRVIVCRFGNYMDSISCPLANLKFLEK